MTDAMLYDGRINALAGESGGGKSWVALHTCAEAIKDGLHVLYVDLEDHPDSIVGRLKTLGVDGAAILERFHYINPGGPMTDKAMHYLDRVVAKFDVALIVIDSLGELMALQGVKPNDDDAVAGFMRAIPRALANLGPAVLVLDHVPKVNDQSPLFAIGSQRKRAAIDGAMFMVETVKAFAAGTDGKIILRTAKDRSGNFVTGRVAAELTLNSLAGGDRLVVTPRAAETATDGSHVRRTTIMGKISRYLEQQPTAAASTNQIEKSVGSQNFLRAALDDMVTEGWINRYDGPRRAVMYCLLRAFDETAEPPNGWPADPDSDVGTAF